MSVIQILELVFPTQRSVFFHQAHTIQHNRPNCYKNQTFNHKKSDANHGKTREAHSPSVPALKKLHCWKAVLKAQTHSSQPTHTQRRLESLVFRTCRLFFRTCQPTIADTYLPSPLYLLVELHRYHTNNCTYTFYYFLWQTQTNTHT